MQCAGRAARPIGELHGSHALRIPNGLTGFTEHKDSDDQKMHAGHVVFRSRSKRAPENRSDPGVGTIATEHLCFVHARSAELIRLSDRLTFRYSPPPLCRSELLPPCSNNSMEPSR